MEAGERAEEEEEIGEPRVCTNPRDFSKLCA